MVDVTISGPVGRIEGKYYHSPLSNPHIALVTHPDPLRGGSMHNKVVYRMFSVFRELQFSVLRFNFRGVGLSQGVSTANNGDGELVDAATCLDWLEAENPDAASVWVAGFSFGSYIGLHLLMRRPEIEGFVVASPPVSTYDISFLNPCPASGLIMQGDNDDIVIEKEVQKFVSKIRTMKKHQVRYHVMPGCDHFFTQNIDGFTSIVADYVKERTDIIPRIPVSARKERKSTDGQFT